jgi:phosphoglycerol transferase MdoB-like AlkP superfamily enzyme
MAIIDSYSIRRIGLVNALVGSRLVGIAAIAAIHGAALLAIYRTEYGSFAVTLAVLTWAFLNFFCLTFLRRPAIAATLSLVLFESAIVLSQFKFSILEMTLSFFDMLIVDADTIAFLLIIFPDLRTASVAAAIIAVPLLVFVWRFDPFRLRVRMSSCGAIVCFAALTGLASMTPEQPWEPFSGINHISNFVRSAVVSVSELITHGWLESDLIVAGRLKANFGEACHPPGKPPHIIMVLDESSFDIRAAPGIKVPVGYGDHFRSFDGETRSFMVEATGGPTWYSEYNVLTGLSARSYGRFMFNVTRIAAGRVRRGLPQALRRCNYKTFSLYPAYGAFLSARRFQTTTGVEQFTDLSDMGVASGIQPDRFYFEQAWKVVRRERSGTPLFIFVYTAANHFPWTSTFRPDLTPDWKGLGNAPEVEEYIRRQSMSARDYSDFLARLSHDFPRDQFLLVRFGDHQPAISARILEPSLDSKAVARRIMRDDPRYFTTYYAIDAVNFRPVDTSSARQQIEAPYLPLIVLDAAGLPLDATFVEQKKIFDRCDGLFYRCNGGSEARRFNGLLIDAGLITGL